ncbi:MAG: hypothetical protein KAH38_12145 [Candidatus Hydrogenedentes bacterium]|nr:hypothetical protein [Candidatus Hydrogenedentota bacterium]
MEESLTGRQLDAVFKLLNGRLERNGAHPVEIVVCGGAALIVTGLLSRTTMDVDIVAMFDDSVELVAPVPLPDSLLRAAREVAEVMQLPENWLNNGPSRGEGGLFQMGLPNGFQDRLHAHKYGEYLVVYFIDRIDQIHFKLYASVDRGGYHISDLKALCPSTGELIQAARWTVTHDVSSEFLMLLKQLLETLGYKDVAAEI